MHTRVSQSTNKFIICQDFADILYQFIFSMILLFPNSAVSAKIKAEISGERQEILLFNPGKTGLRVNLMILPGLRVQSPFQL